MRVQFCFQFIFPPFSFPDSFSREDPNSRGSPLASSLPHPTTFTSLAFSRSPFSAFSLALLLRVSFRFFQSEPSLPPLTFADGELAPSDVLLQPHLSPLPPRTFTNHFNLFVQPRCCPFLFVLNSPFLFSSVVVLAFPSVLSLSLFFSFYQPFAFFLSILPLSFCHPPPLSPRDARSFDCCNY